MRRAAKYARERVVFGRPIGQNQAIQHPLARSWAELEAAWLMTMKAAALYDAGKPCGVEANAAKYLAAEAAFKACETAVMTHGGMGYAREFHVERLRFIRNCRALDMTHAEIRTLLGLMDQPAGDCGGVNQLLDEHIAHVDVRMAELFQLKQQLSDLRQRCQSDQAMDACTEDAGAKRG